ncbi:MAG TPA: glycosyltransferase family 4 protein, partial [Methylomirabilota bacterium]|nr:glycosyltransferase family 4 protein [Methylomirabilota bacterium]
PTACACSGSASVSDRPAPPTPLVIVSNHAEIVGGGEESLLGLLGALDRARWTPAVVVPAEGAVAARARALGGAVHVIPLPSLRRPGPALARSVGALRRLVTATAAALVHANGSRAMAYGGVAARLAHRPVIWHVRIGERDPLLDRALGWLADRVIVISHAVARRFPRALARKVRVVPNGADLERFAPRPPSARLRAALGIPDGTPAVVSVGRFVALKGYGHLLDAAAALDAERPGVHWILVGDGELRADLEARARSLGLAARVHFTGWRDDIPDLMALGDLLVLPSLAEPFGRVLIEAMAMARAVVATSAGGVPEIVVHGETGLLVPPADPRALAAAVRELLDDPARAARLGAAGRRRAQAEFGLARHAAAVGALYDELLSEGHGGL